MKLINPQEAYDLIQEHKGKMFSATFVKNNGTLREINCRTGVKRYLQGGSLAYNPADRLNVPVYDLSKNDYRTIKCSQLIYLSIGGEDYQVIAEGE